MIKPDIPTVCDDQILKPALPDGGNVRKHIIGLDTGGTKCAVILADVSNGILLLDRIAFDTSAEKGFQQTMARLKEGVWAIPERNALTTSDLLGIGASCGGPPDRRRGLVLSPPNLPGWDEIPLVRLLNEAFGVPAYIQNDADALEIFRMAGGKLGAALSVLIDVLNPARIVIGSIFVRCGHLMREEMEQAIEREALIHS